VLLLDEPLSALDPFLRVQIRSELRQLQRDLGTTFVHVTHSQDEALALADQVVVMNGGEIQQSSTAFDVDIEFQGATVLVKSQLNGDSDAVVVRLGDTQFFEHPLKVGEPVCLTWREEDAHALAA